MSDVALVEQKVDALQNSVNALSNDVKEMTKALRDLIRIDGDIRRLEEAIRRIGTESDDHEARIRVLESKGSRRFEALITHGLTSVVGGLVVYLIGKL